MNELTGTELFDELIDHKHLYHFESSTRNLEEVVKAIGYRRDMCGSALDNFLNDNPGAQEAIVDWIRDNMDGNEEWTENVRSELPEHEDDEEEEEE